MSNELPSNENCFTKKERAYLESKIKLYNLRYKFHLKKISDEFSYEYKTYNWYDIKLKLKDYPRPKKPLDITPSQFIAAAIHHFCNSFVPKIRYIYVDLDYLREGENDKNYFKSKLGAEFLRMTILKALNNALKNVGFSAELTLNRLPEKNVK